MAVRTIICLRMLLQMVLGDKLGHSGHINAHMCTDDDDDDDDETPWRSGEGCMDVENIDFIDDGCFWSDIDDVDIH